LFQVGETVMIIKFKAVILGQDQLCLRIIPTTQVGEMTIELQLIIKVGE